MPHLGGRNLFENAVHTNCNLFSALKNHRLDSLYFTRNVAATQNKIPVLFRNSNFEIFQLFDLQASYEKRHPEGAPQRR